MRQFRAKHTGLPYYLAIRTLALGELVFSQQALMQSCVFNLPIRRRVSELSPIGRGISMLRREGQGLPDSPHELAAHISTTLGPYKYTHRGKVYQIYIPRY